MERWSLYGLLLAAVLVLVVYKGLRRRRRLAPATRRDPSEGRHLRGLQIVTPLGAHTPSCCLALHGTPYGEGFRLKHAPQLPCCPRCCCTEQAFAFSVNDIFAGALQNGLSWPMTLDISVAQARQLVRALLEHDAQADQGDAQTYRTRVRESLRTAETPARSLGVKARRRSKSRLTQSRLTRSRLTRSRLFDLAQHVRGLLGKKTKPAAALWFDAAARPALDDFLLRRHRFLIAPASPALSPETTDTASMTDASAMTSSASPVGGAPEPAADASPSASSSAP